MPARTAGIPDAAARPDLPPYIGSVVRLNRTLGALPLSAGNTSS